jgi:hypothetical protein
VADHRQIVVGRARPAPVDAYDARKRLRSRLSIYSVRDKIAGTGPNARVIEHIDPNALVEDHYLVRHAMVDFDDLALLSREAREQLVAELVDAVRFRRGGVKVGKRGVSDKAVTQQIFLSDVARALERAGLPAKRWSKRYNDGDGLSPDAPESFLFRFTRGLADAFGLALPQDLKLPGKRAAQHQYGAMSPAMQAAQQAELALQRQDARKAAPRIVAAVNNNEAATRHHPPPKRHHRRKSSSR